MKKGNILNIYKSIANYLTGFFQADQRFSFAKIQVVMNAGTDDVFPIKNTKPLDLSQGFFTFILR